MEALDYHTRSYFEGPQMCDLSKSHFRDT